jgi:macrodomain Ter protein organizer (MatP/YcbG family)
MTTMDSPTTVKLSRKLRARLGEHARREGATMAGAIEQLLDQAEEAEFWRQVRQVPAAEAMAEAAAFDATLSDGLGDDPWTD